MKGNLSGGLFLYGSSISFTGIESFSKLGDSIYFEEKGDRPVLNIIQYIPSAYNWKAAGLTVNQQLKPISSLDMFLQVSLSTSAKVISFNVRYMKIR